MWVGVGGWGGGGAARLGDVRLVLERVEHLFQISQELGKLARVPSALESADPRGTLTRLPLARLLLGRLVERRPLLLATLLLRGGRVGRVVGDGNLHIRAAPPPRAIRAAERLERGLLERPNLTPQRTRSANVPQRLALGERCHVLVPA